MDGLELQDGIGHIEDEEQDKEHDAQRLGHDDGHHEADQRGDGHEQEHQPRGYDAQELMQAVEGDIALVAARLGVEHTHLFPAALVVDALLDDHAGRRQQEGCVGGIGIAVHEELLGTGFQVLIVGETSMFEEEAPAVGEIAGVGTHGSVAAEDMLYGGDGGPEAVEAYLGVEPGVAALIVARVAEDDVGLLQQGTLEAQLGLHDGLADALEP